MRLFPLENPLIGREEVNQVEFNRGGGDDGFRYSREAVQWQRDTYPLLVHKTAHFVLMKTDISCTG